MTTKVLISLEERITAQQTKLAQLKAQKARLEAAKKAQVAKVERVMDTRRKILAGAVVLNAVELGKMNPDFWHQLIDEGLVKAIDRDLFSLPSKGEVSR